MSELVLNSISLFLSQYEEYKSLLGKYEELAQQANSLSLRLADYGDLPPSEEVDRMVGEFRYIERSIGERKIKLDSVIAKFESLNSQLGLQIKVQKFNGILHDELTKSYVKKLESSLNGVFQYVFQTLDKVILDIIDAYGKKKLDIRMDIGLDGRYHSIKLSSTGGSVSTIVGTVLLIYFILFNGLPRVLMMDEAFGDLEDGVLSRFMEMLKVFTKELNFSFLFVTHDPRIKEFADTVYEARKDAWRLL